MTTEPERHVADGSSNAAGFLGTIAPFFLSSER